LIIVDANLLIYAHERASPEHGVARRWLEARLSGRPRVGLPWPSLVAFVRLVSNPRLVERPTPVSEAWERVREWLGRPQAWVPVAGEEHLFILEQLLRSGGMTSSLVPDAHLAALAIEHGLILCTADRGFARFDGLRWENPLLD
jgi:uncharacterized protein